MFNSPGDREVAVGESVSSGVAVDSGVLVGSGVSLGIGVSVTDGVAVIGATVAVGESSVGGTLSLMHAVDPKTDNMNKKRGKILDVGIYSLHFERFAKLCTAKLTSLGLSISLAIRLAPL